MAVQSHADATWEGDLKGGRGSVTPASGTFPALQLTWAARADSRESGTSPEELLAAAHASCFSMALANALAEGGHPPGSIWTNARVSFQGGVGITGIHLAVRGRVPGIDGAQFKQAAEETKVGCPVSAALAGVEITMEATLET